MSDFERLARWNNIPSPNSVEFWALASIGWIAFYGKSGQAILSYRDSKLTFRTNPKSGVISIDIPSGFKIGENRFNDTGKTETCHYRE